MPEETPKPRMTFWGPREETIPQGFKENKRRKEAEEAEAKAKEVQIEADLIEAGLKNIHATKKK